jgi:hypothetical protein
VILSIENFAWLIKDGEIDKEELPYFIAETIVHEVIHVLEDWAGVEFNEEKVDKIISKLKED